MKDDEPAPDPLSALQQALDDGQEIKMHRFWNPRTQQNEYPFASTPTATSKPSTWTL